VKPTPNTSTEPPEDEVLTIIEPLCAVFRRGLKAEGLKYTPERAAILDTVIRIEGLFAADEVIDRVRGSGFRVSKATVYRTFRLMMELGIIQRVTLSDEQTRYQLVYGLSSRDMIVRIDTHTVTPIEVPELREICERICRERGLTLVGHRLQVLAKAPGD